MARRRVLLKISGESLCGAGGFGLERSAVSDVSRQIKNGVADGKIELAVVVGGGNFLRGRNLEEQGIDRATGDGMGMLATIMNALALRSALEREGVDTRVLSAVACGGVAEPFVRRRCTRHLEKGRVVILGGGTGHPFFTTDTTAALRGLEIQADVILKGTKVDGIYSSDPVKNPEAELFESLTFLDVLQKELKVMDAAAISLCMEQQLPIVVFNMIKPGNLERALRGESVGTTVG